MIYSRNGSQYVEPEDPWHMLGAEQTWLQRLTSAAAGRAATLVPLTRDEFAKVDDAKKTAQKGMDVSAAVADRYPDSTLARDLYASASYLMKNAMEIEQGKDRDWSKLDRDLPVVKAQIVDGQRLLGTGSPAVTAKPDAPTATESFLPARAPAAGMGMLVLVGIGAALLLGGKGRRRR